MGKLYYCCRFPKHTETKIGPLHMSLVTELARLSGRILLSVHMGHFSPVDRDEIQETKPNGETNLYRSRLS